MSNNRFEQQALINALAATVDLVELQAAIVQLGYVFRKDVVTTANGTSGLLNVSFTGADQLVYNLDGDATFNFLNLQDGDICKLIVNKLAANKITLNADAISQGQSVGLTVVQFMVWSANGKTFVKQMNDQTEGVIPIGDLSVHAANDGTVDTLVFCKWRVVQNTVFFDLNIDVSIPSTGAFTPAEVYVDIANFPILPEIVDEIVSVNMWHNLYIGFGTRGSFFKYLTTTDKVRLSFSFDTPATSGAVSGKITASGSLKVK